MLMVPNSMGFSRTDTAEGWGAELRNADTLAAKPRSREGTAAAHGSKAAPATPFISGYTDLRNEGRAPNVLSLPVPPNIPILLSCFLACWLVFKPKCYSEKNISHARPALVSLYNKQDKHLVSGGNLLQLLSDPLVKIS